MTLIFAPVTILWISQSQAHRYRRRISATALPADPAGDVRRELLACSCCRARVGPIRAIPPSASALLALTVAARRAPIRRLRDGGRSVDWPRGLAAFAMFGCRHALVRYHLSRATPRPSPAAIESIAPHPTIAAITADLSFGFPLTGMVHGRWAQRTPSLLIAASVRRRKSGLDPATLAQDRAL